MILFTITDFFESSLLPMLDKFPRNQDATLGRVLILSRDPLTSPYDYCNNIVLNKINCILIVT